MNPGTAAPPDASRSSATHLRPERSSRSVVFDGNEAVASVAYRLNEAIAIYPITPASPMGEFADAWAAAGRPNLYGAVPSVVEMQSEGGAAGAIHGAIQAGALSTTFTASQGLLLMLPNMYKVAGELTPCTIHVAARTLATHALSIFGDHSDVMSARSTGWAMLCAASVQEAHDFALLAQAATLESRVPFLHFFDGFRTSHEVNCIERLEDDDLAALVPREQVEAFRRRSLDPDRPVLRGSAQNPDVFFQAREAANPYYEAVPGIVARTMDRLAERTGRRYRLFDYTGAPDAERVLVMMGSGSSAAQEAVEDLCRRGERVGLLRVRLYRPFDARAFVGALPASVRAIAVLDRCKEPGALGEPLYQDVVTAVAEQQAAGAAPTSAPPRILGGRYGLSSKEFTPAMAMAVFAELEKEAPKLHFTVGITDDVTQLSLPWDREHTMDHEGVTQAVFYGLGSDGTVGACKNSVKIIGESTDQYAQGYFVYDSKKAGAVTVSHLRFGPDPIDAAYLVQKAGFVACHQFEFLEKFDVLELAEPGATFLVNSPYRPDAVWRELPVEVQEQILEKGIELWVVDALSVARAAGMGTRINTVMQTCFFALSGILPREEAIAQIKEAIRKTYGRRGEVVLRRNFEAVDRALDAMDRVKVPEQVEGERHRRPFVPDDAPDFVSRVSAVMMAGKGDLLPVSALPVDGTFPVGTARYEKRSIAHEIPIWDPAICIECNLCALVCPHAAIRAKAYDPALLTGQPAGFRHREATSKAVPDAAMTIQVAPDDCTGCEMCVQICPARSKEVARHKAINMEPKLEHLERERESFEFFLGIPEVDRSRVQMDNVAGTQLLQPLFEFSGACAGCGETPYVKLVSQLFGDRMLVANATGCSSIYGGNLPTTPWCTDSEGRGPAWSNSLFEDNAEFGLGMRLALDVQQDYARLLLDRLRGEIGEELATELLATPDKSEAGFAARRRQVEQLLIRLKEAEGDEARELRTIAGSLVPRSVWIIGGDGWAYDIGFGGVDHVLASGRDVNLLVLDTGVYSNTGGQASKATPRAAVAKFASGGREVRKKDLGLIASAYGGVYVAQVAFGANPKHTLRALREAESYPGPSLVIAYSHCIAHGIDMSKGVDHHKLAVNSGFWPLYRYDPRLAHDGGHPFQLDSRRPKVPFATLAAQEARFAMLARANPGEADELLELAQKDIDDRWHFYEQMAKVETEAEAATTEATE